MPALRLEHGGHRVGRGPHALADLGPSPQSGPKADVHVPVLVGADPRRFLHVRLGDDRAALHHGVDLVAGAVQEAGVDEDDPLAGGADAFLQVDGSAPLLVHDADLEGVGADPEGLFDPGEERYRGRDFLRAVHLRAGRCRRFPRGC